MNKSIADTRLFKIVFHVAAWLFFVSLPFLSGMTLDENRLIKVTAHTLILAIFFYTNTSILIPRYLKKGKIGIYILAVIFSIGIIFFYYQLVDLLMQTDVKMVQDLTKGELERIKGREARKIYNPIFSAIFIFALSSSIKITNEWIKNEKQKKEMENEKLISQLSFLKSQVSPHFLFNTLNNIYSLSLSNSSDTSDAILKLSHLLRYMLYESQDKVVSLEKEIGYLKNYMDLQKMRLTKEVKIDFQINGSLAGKMIEPMLLIPFVENAFKHGINYSGNSFVTILIELSEKKLLLRVENSVYQNTKEKKENSGIGLTNIIKRLELLYPDKHSLDIKSTEEKYTVELILNMNS